MDILDDIILKAYSNIPKPTRHYLTKVIRDGMRYEIDESDEVYVRVHGNLHKVLKVFQPNITILSIELMHPNPKRFVKMFQGIVANCPNLNVLKFGYNASAPMRLDPKSDQKFCLAVTKLITQCPKLEHLDMRDVVMSRSMYNVICDLYQLKSLSATITWMDLETPTDTVCKDHLFKKIVMLRKLDLMCFKQYTRRFPGPTVKDMRVLTIPKEGIMCGLSALLNTKDVEWVFNCDHLTYLDLEVNNNDILKPSSAELWNQFRWLAYLKIYSKRATGVPPLKKVETLTHILYDVKITEPDWNKWYRANMPDSLEFGAFFGVKQLQRDMFTVVAETTPLLKNLYVGYAEDNEDHMICPTVIPYKLRYTMILKNNKLESKSDHHAMGALYMKKKFDTMVFKLDGFERPRNSRMPVVWRDFMHRLHNMRTHPVVLDWRIPVLRHAMFDFLDCNLVTPDMKSDSDEEEDDDEEGMEEEGGDEGSGSEAYNPLLSQGADMERTDYGGDTDADVTDDGGAPDGGEGPEDVGPQLDAPETIDPGAEADTEAGDG